MSSWRFTVYTIVISLAVGAASGVLGTALTSSYLSDYAVALAELTGPLRRSQERPHPLPASYQEAVERLAESALPSVAEIYQGAPGALGFGEEDRFRIGVVLTGDGWVAVQASSAGPFSLKGAHARIRGQMFEIAQSVYDGATRTIFVKVDAAGLPVAAFGKGREMQTGDQAFLAFGPASFASVRLIAHRWPGAALVSSDEPNRFLQVDREAAIGDILFNLNGEVVAIARADGAFLPMEALQPSLRSLLEHQRVTRPSLGVRYLDVAHAVQASDTLTRSLAQGALLYGASSVPRASAAFRAGLRASDIILSVNGETVDGVRGLDELIAQYRPGERVQLLFDRGGEKRTVEVELAEQK